MKSEMRTGSVKKVLLQMFNSRVIVSWPMNLTRRKINGIQLARKLKVKWFWSDSVGKKHFKSGLFLIERNLARCNFVQRVGSD